MIVLNKISFKSKNLSIIIFFSFKLINAQIAPGGVTVGLETWVKANVGVTGTATVTAWANQVPTGTAVVVNGTPSLNTTSTSYNYNPYLEFAGPTTPRQYLSLSGLNVNNGILCKALFNVAHLTNLTRTTTHLAIAEGVTNATPVNGSLHGGVSGSGTAGLMSPTYEVDFLPLGSWRQNGAVVTFSASHLSTKNLMTAITTNNNPTTINRFLGGQLPNITFTTPYLRDWRGPSAEIIAFTSSLSATNVQKIESYLGLKYGLTLPTNYLSTSGVIIYAPTASYTNNIIGIGKDDAEALTQKQSHNNDDSTRVYINNIAATNAANAGSFTNDISYVVMGSDKGIMCSNSASNSEKPAACGLLGRLSREWKVTNTNYTQTFNMDITLNACATSTSTNVADLVLLVDDDGNFGTGTTNCYFNGDGTGIVFSYVNPVITISNISNTHIANNITKFITIASKSILTPLPIELVDFKGNCNDDNNGYTLNWTTASEINNDYFVVEKSMNAINWQQLAIIDGAGNSTSLKNYTYTDTETGNEITYYRLKQIDYNGKETIYDSKIYTENCNLLNQTIEFYPNPATHSITIKNASKYTYYSIINMLGQSIQQSILSSETINISNLASGIYHLKLQDDRNNTFTKKMLIIPSLN